MQVTSVISMQSVYTLFSIQGMGLGLSNRPSE